MRRRVALAAAIGPTWTAETRADASPPYLHDGRLLTLEDSVESFDLVLATRLTREEKDDLVPYLRCL